MARRITDTLSEEPDTWTPPAPRLPVAGEQVHFLKSGRSIPQSLPGEFGGGAHLTRRGETITITDRLIDAAKDRLGGPGWIGLVYDEDAQIERFGAVWMRPGPAPTDLEPWEHGRAEWEQAREQARRVAWAEDDPEIRAQKVREHRERFGALPTSKSVQITDTPSARAARAQDERLRQAGVQHIASS